MNAIMGEAAPGGGGGGAKHIALGTDSKNLPLNAFIGVTTPKQTTLAIEEIPGLVSQQTLELSINPARNKEWRISRQHLNRYPLWTEQYGFPKDVVSYDQNNPPIIFIINLSGKYHARFCLYSQLTTIAPTLKQIIHDSTRNTGIIPFTNEYGDLLGLNIPPAEDDVRIEHPPVSSQTPIPPIRQTSGVVTRYIRESKYGKELKKEYNYKCCFCEIEVERPFDFPYVESCHLKPLNEEGPDSKENLLILCPNHHIELDYGAISIKEDMTLVHINKQNPLHGKTIILRHELNPEFIRFHYRKWQSGELMGY